MLERADVIQRPSDHFIVRMYESLRDEALTHDRLGFPPAIDKARERAEELYQQIERHAVFCTRIERPEENTMVENLFRGSVDSGWARSPHVRSLE
ncbi:hypothetical protein BF49_2587 [Bradyrhizobium sp.]|uniref:hypothetical protein n=1 Tax=Bradyrhizobium sp. TaxID=376 RepID=UPI0007C17E2E|nr:hypothetical protein [Bradyrhizobium sp.]CUT11507.1 hypothetical protein BF49_2587 [Bradyrhizobium sp.]